MVNIVAVTIIIIIILTLLFYGYQQSKKNVYIKHCKANLTEDWMD